MNSYLYIRILAILLTFSMVGELVMYIHAGDAITLEQDTDNEEENKEDKLKEFTISLTPGSYLNTEPLSFNSIYLQVSWEIPETDEQTPPPEFV